MSCDTTLFAAVPTCGLERVGQRAASVRYSGVGHNFHEGVGEWYPSGLSRVFVGAVHSHFPIFQTCSIERTNGTNKGLVSVTTITALLALHIESALDPAETDLVRSMARISISQTMLVLTQGKEIPALKRALPVFEEILAKKNLYLVPNILGQVPAQWQSQDNSMADAYTSPNTQVNIVPSQLEQGESNLPLYGDFLGLDFWDDWRLGSWSSIFDVDMGSQERAE